MSETVLTADQPSVTISLVPFATAELDARDNPRGEYGFRVWDDRTQTALPYNAPAVAQMGLIIFRAAGAWFRRQALQDPGFEPGRPVHLQPEPTNLYDEAAIGIWNQTRRVHTGFVPRQLAEAVGRGLASGTHTQFLVLAQRLDLRSGERLQIEILAAPDVRIRERSRMQSVSYREILSRPEPWIDT